jgi:hypothetical protein
MGVACRLAVLARNLVSEVPTMTSDALPACYSKYAADAECQRCRSLGPCYLAEQKRRRESEKRDEREEHAE